MWLFIEEAINKISTVHTYVCDQSCLAIVSRGTRNSICLIDSLELPLLHTACPRQRRIQMCAWLQSIRQSLRHRQTDNDTAFHFSQQWTETPPCEANAVRCIRASLDLSFPSKFSLSYELSVLSLSLSLSLYVRLNVQTVSRFIVALSRSSLSSLRRNIAAVCGLESFS